GKTEEQAGPSCDRAARTRAHGCRTHGQSDLERLVGKARHAVQRRARSCVRGVEELATRRSRHPPVATDASSPCRSEEEAKALRQFSAALTADLYVPSPPGSVVLGEIWAGPGR